MARPSRRVGNLPAEATSFIGRRRELAELRKKLTDARLVTLVGPGGVGKTRLAIRLADCEHLLEQVARLVTQVLRAAPGVRILATSRERLSAAGEHVLPVPSSCPPVTQMSL